MLKGLGIERIKRMRDHYASHIKDGKKLGLQCFQVKASDVNSDNRIIDVLATTDAIDLDREVVVPSGCDLSVYKLNKRNFIDHEYRFGCHVGTMRSCSPWPSAKNFRGLRNRSQILAGLKNPIADDLLTVARQAGIAASIGFEMVEGSKPIDIDPPEYQRAEWVIRSCRIIELSFTAMPCNVTCQSMDDLPSVDLDQRMGQLEELVVKGRKHGGIALASGIALGLSYRKVHAVRLPAAPEVQGKKRPAQVTLE